MKAKQRHTLSKKLPGIENINKIYAESFHGADHLRRTIEEAQAIVSDTLAASPQQPGITSETNVKERS
jgi:phosphoglucomutase